MAFENSAGIGVYNHYGQRTTGGSIGSELCRQISTFSPKKLVLLDIYENTTYDIQLELKRNYPQLNLDVIIGSVRDKDKIDEVFEEIDRQCDPETVTVGCITVDSIKVLKSQDQTS